VFFYIILQCIFKDVLNGSRKIIYLFTFIYQKNAL